MKITELPREEMSVRNYKKRVVITGVGPVTPIGIGKEAYWESVTQGKSSFRRISFPERDMSPYRCQNGAPIEGFDLSKYINPTKHTKRLGRTSQLSITAARRALMDAGIEMEEKKEGNPDRHQPTGEYELKNLDPFQIGVILGVGVESMDLLEHFHERFLSKGPRSLSPFGLPNIYLSSITSHVNEFFTLRATSYALSTACASGTHAMINSFLQIQGGGEDVMVTGGAEGGITPYVFW